MSTKNYCIAIVTLLSVLPMTLSAQSMDEVLKSISENNLQLQIARLEANAKVLDMKAENQPNALGIEYIPQYAKGYSGMMMSEMNITEEFDFPTIYAARKRQTALESEALNYAFEAEKIDVMREAKMLCLDIIRLNQTIELCSMRVAQTELLQQAEEASLNAGNSNIMDMNKVKLELMDARKLMAQAEGERLSMIDKLKELNGGKDINLTDNTFPETALPANFHDYLSTVAGNTPAIAAQRASVKAAEHDVKVSKMGWLPSVNIGYRRTKDSEQAIHGIIMGVNFPVFSNSAKVKASKVRVESAKLQLQEADMKLKNSLQDKYDEVMKVRNVMDHSDTKLLRETLPILEKAWKGGEISTREYCAECATIYGKLQEHIELHCQYCKSIAELMTN